MPQPQEVVKGDRKIFSVPPRTHKKAPQGESWGLNELLITGKSALMKIGENHLSIRFWL
jgi:hypothetical protein